MKELAQVLAAFPELTKAIYEDLAQESFRNVGKALGVITKRLSRSLNSVQLGNIEADEYLRKNILTLKTKLETEDSSDIQEIPPEILVPSLRQMAFTQEPNLVELYTELLRSAALKSKCANAHPSFVNIIANLSPDEVRMLEVLKNIGFDELFVAPITTFQGNMKIATIREYHVLEIQCDFPNNLQAYLSNLRGLGLLYDSEVHYRYELELWSSTLKSIEKLTGHKFGPSSEPLQVYGITEFGYLFIKATHPDPTT